MFPEIHWKQLALPPRNFSWRIRSNSLHWASYNRDELCADYVFLLATSMTDLSSLRGLVPQLSRMPTIVYFHENQFAYPNNKQQKEDRKPTNIEPLLVPIYAALCADKIVFNTTFNKSTFINGARNLFNILPDKFPPSIIEKLESAVVVPVPIEIPQTQAMTPITSELLEVVWNHRWEYDKGPELLLAIIELVIKQNLPIRFHVVGENFRQQPPAFDQIKSLLSEYTHSLAIEAGAYGFIREEREYYDLLARCDVILSTAMHDFQGLALQEACLADCTPLAPNDLAYPEYLPTDFLYDNELTTVDTAQLIVQRLKHLLALKKDGSALPKADLTRFTTEGLRTAYSELFSFG